jgi:hypothetical protein
MVQSGPASTRLKSSILMSLSMMCFLHGSVVALNFPASTQEKRVVSRIRGDAASRNLSANLA